MRRGSVIRATASGWPCVEGGEGQGRQTHKDVIARGIPLRSRLRWGDDGVADGNSAGLLFHSWSSPLIPVIHLAMCFLPFLVRPHYILSLLSLPKLDQERTKRTDFVAAGKETQVTRPLPESVRHSGLRTGRQDPAVGECSGS